MLTEGLKKVNLGGRTLFLASKNPLNSLISHLIIMGITKKPGKNIERQTTQDTDELQFILSIVLHCSSFH